LFFFITDKLMLPSGLYRIGDEGSIHQRRAGAGGGGEERQSTPEDRMRQKTPQSEIVNEEKMGHKLSHAAREGSKKACFNLADRKKELSNYLADRLRKGRGPSVGEWGERRKERVNSEEQRARDATATATILSKRRRTSPAQQLSA